MLTQVIGRKPLQIFWVAQIKDFIQAGCVSVPSPGMLINTAIFLTGYYWQLSLYCHFWIEGNRWLVIMDDQSLNAIVSPHVFPLGICSLYVLVS